MVRKCDDLYQRPIQAIDGELGKLSDLYLDDRSWQVQYLVVELGSWFKSKRVLISPSALAEYDGSSLKVHLTKHEISTCPDSNADKPVSLQEKEHSDARYTMVQSYGVTSGLNMVLPFVPPGPDDDARINSRWNRHLRSSRRLSRYTLCTEDGADGSIKDFLVDDRTWNIRYVIFRLSAPHNGPDRLLETKKINTIEWAAECLNVESICPLLARCPEFDRERHINISYEDLKRSIAGQTPDNSG
jgi:sporulation protein YlmC with PRC-barrel domain